MTFDDTRIEWVADEWAGLIAPALIDQVAERLQNEGGSELRSVLQGEGSPLAPETVSEIMNQVDGLIREAVADAVRGAIRDKSEQTLRESLEVQEPIGGQHHFPDPGRILDGIDAVRDWAFREYLGESS